MHATGWSRGLEVTGGGSGVVSHGGLVLLRQLADRTGLTAGLSAALPSPLGGAASAPTSTPRTASTPASRTSSAPGRTPAWDISHRMTTG